VGNRNVIPHKIAKQTRMLGTPIERRGSRRRYGFPRNGKKHGGEEITDGTGLRRLDPPCGLLEEVSQPQACKREGEAAREETRNITGNVCVVARSAQGHAKREPDDRRRSWESVGEGLGGGP